MIEELNRRGGIVRFETYMEIALYHPEYGYYSGALPRYGRRGDYLTAPTASPWYARVFARILRRTALREGPLVFVDLAAGNGSFLQQVLEILGEATATVVSRVLAVEQSPAMRAMCSNRLPHATEILSSLEDARPPEGPAILHASELYDALPVARSIMGDDELEEFFVCTCGDRLCWHRQKARKEVEDYFQRHGINLAPGQIAEANLRAEDLHRNHLEWAGARATALILDYGYDARRLYNPRGRMEGSLSCFFRHELSRNPLSRPGGQDIIAHVNWDDLRRAAETAGWVEQSLMPLALFLFHSGIGEIAGELGLGMDAELDADTISERQELKRLLDPEGMGSDLKVLVQTTSGPTRPFQLSVVP